MQIVSNNVGLMSDLISNVDKTEVKAPFTVLLTIDVSSAGKQLHWNADYKGCLNNFALLGKKNATFVEKISLAQVEMIVEYVCELQLRDQCSVMEPFGMHFTAQWCRQITAITTTATVAEI